MNYRSSGILYFLLACVLMVLSACGSSETTTADKDDKKEATTRVINTVNGDITVPANPKRIVTVEGYLETTLLFGLKPVGAPAFYLKNPLIQDKVEGIEDIGNGDTSSLEKIITLKPDLIITANDDKELYDKLTAIAPTVVYPYSAFKRGEEEVTEFGKLFGKEKEAEAWLKEFEERMKVARERAQKVVGDHTVSLIGAYDKDIYAYGDKLYRGGEALYQHLQLTPPEAVKKNVIGSKDNYKMISTEVLPEYAGDYLFVDQSYGGKLDQNSSVFKGLDAVKNDRVFFPDPERFWPYDPYSVAIQAEEFADMLEERNK